MPRPKRANTLVEKRMLSPSRKISNDNPDIFYTEADIGDESRQCRICLEGQSPDNTLITPCRCTGSVQFIHENCIKQWIQKSREKKIDPIKCELCKQPIIYSVINSRQCNKFQTIKSKITLNYKIFLFLFFLFLINCGVTIYLIVIFAHVIEISSGDPKFIEIGVISFSIVLLLVISSVIFGIIIRQFVYSEVKKIGQVINLAGNLKRRRTISIDNKLNFSKGQIYPLNIAQIEQVQ